jgi:hypothetical protein
MKLAHYQIEHIREYIKDQNIWYYDVRQELVDHIASAIESKIEEEEISFSKAFAEAIEGIDCRKVQRKRMKIATFLAHKNMKSEIFNLFQSAQLLMPFTCFLGFYLLFSNTDQANLLIILFKTIGIAALIIPLLISLLDKKYKPYNYTFFMGAYNGSFLSIIVIAIPLDNYMFFDSIHANAYYYAAFFTVLFTIVYLTNKIAFAQYNLIKKYASQ